MAYGGPEAHPTQGSPALDEFYAPLWRGRRRYELADESIATPCSVKVWGSVRRPLQVRNADLEVTICDLKFASSYDRPNTLNELAKHRVPKRRAGIQHRYEEFDDDHSDIDYRMGVSLPFLYRALR